jgi:hypothetical protein
MGTYGIKDGRNIEQILADATVITTLPPYCYPIDVSIDQEQLQTSFLELFIRLGLEYNTFCKDEEAESSRLTALFTRSKKPFAEWIKSEEAEYGTADDANPAIAWDMNLNHLPNLVGHDRWRKYKGQFEHIFAQGVTPRDYTEVLKEIKGLYLEKVIQNIFEYYQKTYNKEFKGRANVIWIGAGQGYNFHVDSDVTPIRYHIPLFTNKDAVWLFNEPTHNVTYKMHMPVGTAWQFFPTSIEHTVINKGTEPRAHLIITEVLELV